MISHLQDVEAVRGIAVVPSILATVCALTGMGFAAVARVTEDRWVACSVEDKIAFGLEPGGELLLETTICNEIRHTRRPVIIADVPADPLFFNHHTPAMYGFRSYISMPIVLRDGRFFGTLCAIDPEPRDLARPEIEATFRMFAELIGFHLDAVDKFDLSETQLASAVETGALREEFIAVLGHDLRNPLASIQAGVTMLGKNEQTPRGTMILGQMQHSVDRMGKLIDNILDFARGRLGGGFSLDRRSVAIEPLLRGVVNELAASHPERQIVLDCAAPGLKIDCDPARIEQVVSNLLGNALTHGATDQPVTVHCALEGDAFVLSVANGGDPIPESARAGIFQPFARGVSGGMEGLGLGLYITAQIAAAHDGKVTFASTKAETRFTVTLPAVA